MAGAASAESQTRSRQIGPAVFGGTGTRADKPGGLDLSAQLFVSYDDDVLADQSGGGPDRPGVRPVCCRNVGDCTPGFRSAFSTPGVGRNTTFTVETNQLAQLLSRTSTSLTTTYHQVGRHCGPPVRQAVHDARAAHSLRIRRTIRCGFFLAPLPVDPASRRTWMAPSRQRLMSIPRSSSARVFDTAAMPS